MLPNMSRVLIRLERPVELITVTQTIVDFKPVDVETSVSTKAVVQPAQKENLNPEIIDWSLIYKQVHSKLLVKLGDLMTVDGVKYKAVELGDYNAYGYYETIFEEVK